MFEWKKLTFYTSIRSFFTMIIFYLSASVLKNYKNKSLATVRAGPTRNDPLDNAPNVEFSYK